VLYRRMLDLFSQTETDFAQRFRAARAADDTEAAMRAVHDLKGEAGTLGMSGLQQAAAALERVCMEGADDPGIDDALREVSRRLGECIDEIRGLVGPNPP